MLRGATAGMNSILLLGKAIRSSMYPIGTFGNVGSTSLVNRRGLDLVPHGCNLKLYVLLLFIYFKKLFWDSKKKNVSRRVESNNKNRFTAYLFKGRFRGLDFKIKTKKFWF